MLIHRRTFAICAAAVLGVLAAAAPAMAAPATTSNTTSASTVTVDAGHRLGPVRSDAIGADEPFWNGALSDPRTPALIRQAGITKLDFDAGGPIDLYHWKTNTISPDPGGGADPVYAQLKPKFSFDQFERVARESGASTMVHVNYGTGPDSTTAKPTPGDPAEAAAWVHYANGVRHDNVRYWAVGEETYLDGMGEPDGHTQKTPAEYGKEFLAYAKAMKKADPNIKVGAEMFAVDPAQAAGSGFLQHALQWDREFLKTPGIGRAMDFADIHWLSTGGQTDDQIMSVADHITPALTALRTQLAAVSGRHHVSIIAGEVNSAVSGAAQQSSEVNALYLADDSLTLLENGAIGADWWALHSGFQGDAKSGYGDLGLLSSGDCIATTTTCAPPIQTRYPTYYGMQLFSTVARPGSTLLAGNSSSAKISVHATRRPDGSLAVLVINKDLTAAHRVTLRLRGFTARPGAIERSYGKSHTGIRTAYHPGRVDSLALAPSSMTTVILRPGR